MTHGVILSILPLICFGFFMMKFLLDMGVNAPLLFGRAALNSAGLVASPTDPNEVRFVLKPILETLIESVC